MNSLQLNADYKNSILKALCEALPSERLMSISLKSLTDSKSKEEIALVTACLNLFKDKGLLLELSIRGDNCQIILASTAFNFLHTGGFAE
ncbi:hypothetical protein [Rikenella microfusus]|uniref:hypothetical protein n=1 Tax=Rikenella microfusus TaxID=28139 RepID=UPI0011C06A03|nr:hypothetical protein [Rikenella microfusus]